MTMHANQTQMKTNLVDITTPAEAERFCDQLNMTIDQLRDTIERETGYLKNVNIPEVETLQARKTALSRAYAQDLGIFATNASRISELMPSGLEALQQKQLHLREALMDNARILGAVKDVSESLIRRTAERVAGASQPKTYAPPAAGKTAPQTAAVACDRRL